MEYSSNPPQPEKPSAASSQSPVPGQPSQVVYVQAPPSHPIRRWLSWAGWMAFFFALSIIVGMSASNRDYFGDSAGVQEKFHSGARTAQDKIAIIDVSGVIGTKSDFVKKQIDRVKKDDNVKAVVLRVESPGGTITGSDYIYHHLLDLRKEREIPLVVSMGSIATSGGYYVAMAVGDEPQSIYAEPTTTTGSIGVIIPHYDLSGLLERFDIKDDSLVSHPRKMMLSMTRPISEDDRQVLEAYLGDAFDRFKEVVKSGRPALRQDDSKLDQLATGQIFTATQAKENGLVDELGFVEDAIERAAELAELTSDSYRVVQYKAPTTFLSAISSMKARGDNWQWEALLELSTPKAYYLSTSLPALAPAATSQ